MRDLPEPVRTVVSVLISRCEASATPAYLVGGPVRDNLLGHPSLDIDIVVEGDAMELARSSEGDPNVTRVVRHPAFGTATVRLAGAHVDLITARSETYSQPGVLPRVTPGRIEDDLARRDFTVNAMALRLTGPARGQLLDPHEGRADLEARLVRALHEPSFQDDATRVLRAVRYAVRLRFEIEAKTLGWMQRDLGFLHEISGTRLHNEFARIMRETSPEAVLTRLEDLGALSAVDPWLRFTNVTATRFREVGGLTSHVSAAMMWALIAWDIPPADCDRLERRLRLTNAQREALQAIPAAKHAAQHILPSAASSEVVHVLAPLPEPTLVALAAVSGDPVRATVMDFLTTLRHVRPILRGDDAIELGVQRGPRVAEVLDLIRVARLNGAADTREDEERLVRDYVARTT